MRVEVVAFITHMPNQPLVLAQNLSVRHSPMASAHSNLLSLRLNITGGDRCLTWVYGKPVQGKDRFPRGDR